MIVALSELKFLSDTIRLECESELIDTEDMKFEVGELCCARFPGKLSHII